MSRPAALYDGTALSLARTVTGVIAADNASLIDANYPIASGIDCTGFDTIFVGVEIAGGTAPTATIEALFRDDSGHWFSLNQHKRFGG